MEYGSYPHKALVFNIHHQSTPRDVLYEQLREACDDPDAIVFAEVDQLDEKDVLYTLPHITMILVANDEQEFYANLSDRLYSRLTGNERFCLNGSIEAQDGDGIQR